MKLFVFDFLKKQTIIMYLENFKKEFLRNPI